MTSPSRNIFSLLAPTEPLAIWLAFTVATVILVTTPACASDRDRLSYLLETKPFVHAFTSDRIPAARFLSYRDTDERSATLGLELCVLEIPKGSGRLRVKDLRL